MSSLLLDSSRDTIGHNIMWKQQPKIFTYCINSPTSADGWNLKIKNCVYTSSSARFENYYTWIIYWSPHTQFRKIHSGLFTCTTTVNKNEKNTRQMGSSEIEWDYRSGIDPRSGNEIVERIVGGPTRFTWLAKLSLGCHSARTGVVCKITVMVKVWYEIFM